MSILSAIERKLGREAADKVRVISILHSMRELKLERIDGIINAALATLAATAVEELKGSDITIRDLRPSDLSGPTTDVFAETSETAIGYATTAAGDNTAIADETFLAIWGVKLLTQMGSETAATAYQTIQPPVNGFRITVGSAVVAIWDIYKIVHVQFPDLTDVASGFQPVGGIAESPIIVRQNQLLKIEEYSTTTAADPYQVVFLGAVAEKAGKNISA